MCRRGSAHRKAEGRHALAKVVWVGLPVHRGSLARRFNLHLLRMDACRVC